MQELEVAIARARDVNDLYESEDTQSTAKVRTSLQHVSEII